MSDPTRVLLVTPNYPPPPGGIQSLTANLERGLRAHDVTVEVLVTDQGPTDAVPRDVLSVPRWCHSARSVLSGEAVALAVTYRRARARIDEFRPDVVHAMHVVDWPALVAASEAGVPSVVTTHALELGRTSLARRAVGAATLVHAVSEFTRDLTREVAKDPVRGHVIPPSIAVEEYPARAESRSVSGSGSDPDRRSDSESGPATTHGDPTEANPTTGTDSTATATEPVVVTTVARLVERKNVETLIDAVGRLDARLDRDVLLRVIGDGPRRADLEARAASVPVVFEGWVDERQKRAFLARSDVFALVPRRIGFDVEGFGIVYIEAQAAGVPVVGSRHGGVPEAIGDGGLIVENERRASEVANALERLLTDAECRARCVAAAQRRIDGFDLSAVATRHVEAYETARSMATGSAGSAGSTARDPSPDHAFDEPLPSGEELG